MGSVSVAFTAMSVRQFHWQSKFDYYKYPFVDYMRGESMTIECDKPQQINVDGECRAVQKVTFEIVPSAFTFILPKDTPFFKDIESGKTGQGMAAELLRRPR